MATTIFENEGTENIENAVVTVTEALGVMKMCKTLISWIFCDGFKSIKPNVIYRNNSQNPDWTFRMKKLSSHLNVTISTDNSDREIYCSVCDGVGYHSTTIPAKRLIEGVYEVSIPGSFIPENAYETEECMTLIFEMIDCEIETPIQRAIETPIQRSIESDNTATCEYFRNMLLNTLKYNLTDFTIRVKGRCLHAHKAMLASRSTYFRQYIQENCKDGERGEIELDEDLDALYCVYTFMYVGTLRFKSPEHLTRILELSEKLGVSNLQILGERHMEKLQRRRE